MREGRNVLVTGAAGFIGSHTVEVLLRDGYQVTGLDSLVNGSLENLTRAASSQSFAFIRGDITDTDCLRKALRNTDAVIHLAAFTSHKESIENPVKFHEVNVTGTLTVLRAASELGVKRLVYASSGAVYGRANKPPYDEDMPLHPESPYAASKVAGEAYCKAYHSAYKLDTVILRYMNVFGPRVRRNDEAGVMVKFADLLLRNEAPHVFGDGTQNRDFTYVADVAEANVLALKTNAAAGEAVNIGTGIPTTVNELAADMAKLLNRSSQTIHEPERSWEIKFSWAKIDKARRALNYYPRIEFKEGLRKFLAWYQHTLGKS